MWGALIAAILGSAIQKKQTTNAGKRARQELAEGRKKSQKIEDTQRTEVLDEAANFDPAVRQAAMDASAAATEGKIQQTLADNELTTTGDVGVLSDKVLAQRGQSTRDKANTASILAALMSKVQAPRDTATADNTRMFNLNADSKGRSNDLTRLNRTTQTLAQLEGQTDPTAMMIGGLLQQGGMAVAGNQIASGMQLPGAGGVATGTAGRGVVNMSPAPWYTNPNSFISG